MPLRYWILLMFAVGAIVSRIVPDHTDVRQEIAQLHAINDGKAQVEAMLKDPTSAVYRDVTFRNGYVCGYVNAKNGFGGYTGFEPFVAGYRGLSFDTSDWQKFCG